MNPDRIIASVVAVFGLGLSVFQTCAAHEARQETISITGQIAIACQRSLEGLPK